LTVAFSLALKSETFVAARVTTVGEDAATATPVITAPIATAATISLVMRFMLPP
jgi:hypothetical protein